MPTCLASSSGLLRTIVRPHNSQSRVLVQYAARKVAGCRRTPLIARRATFATAAGVPPKVEEQRAHTLTLLHKTTSLLPRILPNGPTSSDSVPTNESLQFWENVLGRLYEDLSLAPERKEKARVRVAVYGVDEYSPASDLVTALLEDPFVTDEQKKTLRSRWDAQPEGSRVLKLQYGTSPSGEGDVVNVQSSWLQHFGVQLEVSEYRPSSNAEVVEALYSADVPVLLCNPNTTPLPSILPVSLNPPLPITREHTVLAVSAPSPTHPNTAVQASHIKSLAAREELRVVFVDPARALHGLEQLGHGPASPISVQRYQDDVTGSNVASVTRAVKDILSSAVEEGASLPESSRAVAVHTQTGRALIKDALLTCRTVLRHAELEADAVLTGTSSLRGQMEEAKAKVHMEVFGSPATDGDEIAKAVGQARKSVKVTMDALQWYKLFWRVDDIREVVTAAVDRAWCRDLERKLVYHAGRLAALQASLKDSASALCRSFPPSSPYHSPVLHNSLERLISAPSYPLTASALTAPLHARQSQLGFPTERLHVSAQRAVLTMSGSILGGFGVAWSGWASELGLMGGFINVGMGTETATGVGLLGAVLGVRWAVGRWEKAKKRWWKDWDRVGEGLERDLKATLTQTMDQRVVVVAEKACSGLENIASKRKAEIQQLQDEVRSLESQVDK